MPIERHDAPTRIGTTTPIRLQAVDAQPPAAMAGLAATLAQASQLPIESHHVALDLRPYDDFPRGQLNAALLLEGLAAQALATRRRILAITCRDLYIPMLSYLIGYAQLGGWAGVVSLCRLDNRSFGLAPAPELLRQRLQKEALHELGHLQGLPHCSRVSCVMHSSTDLTEIDLKGAELCPSCRQEATLPPHEGQKER